MIDLRSEPHGYATDTWLLLRGLEGLGEGQQVKLSLGETIVIGRSRHCDWSLRRSPAYLKSADGDRKQIEEDLAFKACSRRHAQIAYVSADMVEIQNLSTNGTLVDGHKVDRIVLTDCRTTAHRLRLGVRGVELELAPGSLPV
jgi:pSer/pThr/pTyr-binding forkhead associated (FHA) protein